MMGAVADALRGRLEGAFAPTLLHLADVSASHAGHAGARLGGESHFELTIRSAAFAGLTRVRRQRLIHAALGPLLAGPVHALSIRALAPEEDGDRGIL